MHRVPHQARVAFCGDYVDGERAATVEGAALSGLATAVRVLAEIL